MGMEDQEEVLTSKILENQVRLAERFMAATAVMSIVQQLLHLSLISMESANPMSWEEEVILLMLVMIGMDLQVTEDRLEHLKLLLGHIMVQSIMWVVLTTTNLTVAKEEIVITVAAIIISTQINKRVATPTQGTPSFMDRTISINLTLTVRGLETQDTWLVRLSIR